MLVWAGTIHQKKRLYMLLKGGANSLEGEHAKVHRSGSEKAGKAGRGKLTSHYQRTASPGFGRYEEGTFKEKDLKARGQKDRSGGREYNPVVKERPAPGEAINGS